MMQAGLDLIQVPAPPEAFKDAKVPSSIHVPKAWRRSGLWPLPGKITQDEQTVLKKRKQPFQQPNILKSIMED